MIDPDRDREKDGAAAVRLPPPSAFAPSVIKRGRTNHAGWVPACQSETAGRHAEQMHAVRCRGVLTEDLTSNDAGEISYGANGVDVLDPVDGEDHQAAWKQLHQPRVRRTIGDS